MKKLTSLLLALGLCLSLTVPAMAYQRIDSPYEDGLPAFFEGANHFSGKNWEFDYTPEGTVRLSISGVNRWSISLDRPTAIELAPGSKSVIDRIEYQYDTMDTSGKWPHHTLTFRGTGELIIDLSDPKWDTVTSEHGVLFGNFEDVYLEDGLTVTGGLKQGDSEPLTLSAPKAENNTMIREYMAGDKPARYLRIGPSAGNTEMPAAAGFTDVAANSPYAEAIKWAVDQKITSGKTATTFGPNDTCTVSHILTFLWRGNGRPGSGDNERAAVTAWAQGLGIDTSSLGAPCTRAMAVSYMWKAAGSPAAKAASFADVPAGADYAGAVSWAVEKGITKGAGGDTFSPGGTCTRGQIVTFLYRASK